MDWYIHENGDDTGDAGLPSLEYYDPLMGIWRLQLYAYKKRK
jgi:hypothetical protein